MPAALSSIRTFLFASQKAKMSSAMPKKQFLPNFRQSFLPLPPNRSLIIYAKPELHEGHSKRTIKYWSEENSELKALRVQVAECDRCNYPVEYTINSAILALLDVKRDGKKNVLIVYGDKRLNNYLTQTWITKSPEIQEGLDTIKILANECQATLKYDKKNLKNIDKRQKEFVNKCK